VGCQREGNRHVPERAPVALLNDLEAMATSVALLEGDEVAVLQRGEPKRAATRLSSLQERDSGRHIFTV
jgi:glucokinase